MAGFGLGHRVGRSRSRALVQNAGEKQPHKEDEERERWVLGVSSARASCRPQASVVHAASVV